jgi:protein-disulfide isomerase/uncharacterized membrane protein
LQRKRHLKSSVASLAKSSSNERMKTRIQVALMGALASFAAHVYLTLHYYPLKFGFAGGQSICNLNAKFDCDAVAASSFSALLGMPLALWGAATNLVLFFLMLFCWLEWSENPERLKRWTLALAGVTLSASVIMGVISLTQMQSYCLFCISIYILSAIVFFSFQGLLKEPFWMHFKTDFAHLWGESKGILGAYAAVPVLVILGHQFFMQNFGSDQLQRLVDESVQTWQSAPKQNFVAKPSLVMGPSADAAKMTLVEFADFRCSHCRHASYTLDAFVTSHPDVRFEFYSFPLDGACNEKIEASSGLSCRLATAVYCAEKDKKGWPLHHRLYDIQDQVNQLATVTELDPVLAKNVSELGLNWDQLQSCMNDPASQDAIRAQAKQGALVNVMGTPTIFVNGRLLDHAQMIPVLESVHSETQH